MTTHTFSTDADPALFLEVDDGTGTPVRLSAGSTVLVRRESDGTALPSTQALALGYLSFTTTDVPGVLVSGDSGVTWKGPFWSKESRRSSALGVSAGSDLIDPATNQLYPGLIPGGTLTGNYAELDPVTGLISASVVPPLNYDAAGAAALVQGDLDTFKTQVPSNEDLMLVWNMGGDLGTTIGGSVDNLIMTTPEDITILGATLVWDDSANFTGMTSSDTDYWVAALSTPSSGVLARRSTQITGPDANGDIVPEIGWDFDGAVWNTDTISMGETLKLALNKVGAPPNIGQEFSLTIRYQRAVVA